MISRDGAVLVTAIICAVVAISFDVGYQVAFASMLTTCRPQPGETLVSVQQRRDELTCTFAAEVIGPRAIKRRRAT